MAFGVTHAFLDAFTIVRSAIGVGLVVVVTIVVVTWWRAGLRALGRSPTGSRLATTGVWVGAVFTFLNGLTILACLPPCGGSFGIADLLHIGALLSPVIAVFVTWRFIQQRAAAPVRARAR